MKTILFFLISILSFSALAQKTVSLDGLEWKLKNNSIKEVYKGNDCLNTSDGDATPLGLSFKNGIIEYDICIQPGRGFAGVRFHEDGKGNAEDFYIRKHQSGNPDAMQYTPVYNGNAGWQLYYGDGYSAAKKFVFDEWFKIRVVIAGTKGEVYIENMDTPILVIHELKRGEQDGGITFYGPARFANVKITKTDSPVLKGSFKEITKAGKEVIQSYYVSEPVNPEFVFNTTELPVSFWKALKFTSLDTEADGLINLSKTVALMQEKNTVLLKIRILAEKDIIKPLSFGFSDAAKIFINGKAAWFGSDSYSSRDYRFLGTIGYFDSVYFDLKTGENTVIIAVAESFGGWGFKAKFDNLDGIKILN
jgi:hypothetical protein